LAERNVIDCGTDHAKAFRCKRPARVKSQKKKAFEKDSLSRFSRQYFKGRENATVWSSQEVYVSLATLRVRCCAFQILAPEAVMFGRIGKKKQNLEPACIKQYGALRNGRGNEALCA
jgi:hypothetical protein